MMIEKKVKRWKNSRVNFNTKKLLFGHRTTFDMEWFQG